MKTKPTKKAKETRTVGKSRDTLSLSQAIEKEMEGASGENAHLKELISTIGAACERLSQLISTYDRLAAISGFSSRLYDAIDRARRDAMEARDLLRCDELGGDAGDPHEGRHYHPHG